jgi:alcohol dehydrogenase class IV
MSELCLPRRLITGMDSLKELGKVAKELQVTHLFVVSGSLLTRDPFESEFHGILHKNGLEATFFSEMKGEPTTTHLSAALIKMKQCGADCVVAIGGGSVIDLAKAVSVMAINEDVTLDAIPGMERLEGLPLIAVPTTAGTGSEATRVTVITDTESQIKKNPGHPKLIPDTAILDPALTVSLPKHMTAYTGLDALSHAMEAYVSTKATPMSDHFALEAIRIIGNWLPEAYENGENLEARENMLLGSCYAGIAFSNASTNLAHAAARPLGSRFHIPHGLSVALLMPFVIEYSLDVSVERYAEIGRALGCDGGDQRKMANEVLKKIWDFNARFLIWQNGSTYFGDAKAYTDAIPSLVQDALSGNGIVTNQKIPNERDIEELYLQLLAEIQAHSNTVLD